MAWFDGTYTFDKSSLCIAHITDSHLFADKNGEYFNVNTAAHFEQALAKHIIANGVELLLINSKGPTPAGWVTGAHLDEITDTLVNSNNSKVIFCHHNPLPINGYLDKHLLENGPQLLNILVNSNNVSALFHGHVHNDYEQNFRGLPIYASPASSVQFVKYTPKWEQKNAGPAYRMLNIKSKKDKVEVKTEVVWLSA